MRSAPLAILVVVALASACGTAREIDAAQTTARCTACHGYPPPPGAVGAATSHPQSASCSLCHADTVDANGDLLPGSKHMDGHVDVTTHALPFVAQHTAAALADIAVCTQCHGAEYDGGASGTSCTGCHETFGFGDWKANCTFCHGTRTAGWTVAELTLAAPPRGVHGETLPSQPAVGAHAKHVGAGSAISNGVACGECHAVPAAQPLAHLDGTALVTFGTLARTGGAAPRFDETTLGCAATYCHGAALLGGSSPGPTWTGSAACGTCHGLPPATGRHAIPEHGMLCVNCHRQVADWTSVGIRDDAAAKALHVNGTKDVELPSPGTWSAADRTCSNVACHQGASIRTWGN